MAFDLASAKPAEAFDLGSAAPVAEPVVAAKPRSDLAKVINPKLGAIVRGGGPIAAGTALGAALGAPFAGVGAIPGAAVGATAAGITQLLDKFMGTNMIDRAMDDIGISRPESATDRVIQDAASGVSGAGAVAKGGELMAKAANPVVKRIGEVMASRQGTQALAGATGSTAAGVTREAGGGPVAQFVAGVGGSALPAAPAGIAEAARRILRGGETGRQRLAANIDTFEDAGAGTPTVGQGTENRLPRAIESTLAKLPGGAGPMAAKAEAEAAGLGANIDQMASTLTPRTGAAPAGISISSGIKDWVKDFKTTSGKLYKDLDRFILPDTPVGVGNAAKVLDELTTVTRGAENLSMGSMNPKIVAMRGQLADDARNGTLPYGAVKELRSRVGKMLEGGGLVNDVPRSDLKKIYGALTADMEAAANQAGPDATAALKRANNHYRSGMKRIDDVLDPVLKKGDPEDIFKAALSGTQEGATTLNGVMKSLPVESKRAVAATVLQRMGKATAGKQNDLGEAFSTETFLTNWNKLHPDSKRVLFSTLPGSMRQDIDKIAAVASNMREGSKVFANPSGTTAGVASVAAATAFGTALYHLNLPAMAAIPAGVGLAYGGGRLMSNPGFVHWLAGTTKVPAEQLPAQLNQLFQESLHMRGDDRKEVREYVKTTRATLRSSRERATQ